MVMSHEIVKSIKIQNAEVWINSACNNVRPLTYSNWKSDYHTKVLLEQGLEACEISILKAYEEGTYQGSGVKKYRKALSILYNVFEEDYKNFNWRNNNFGYNTPESNAFDERRKSKEFEALLLKCLNFKLPKENFVIKQNSYLGVFFGKWTGKCMKWKREIDKASKFSFIKEAERVKGYFPNSNSWEIVDLNEVGVLL